MDRVTGRIWEEIDPDNPVQFVKAFVKFASADEVAAEEALWTWGPYALASLFSFALMNAANPVMYASPFPRDIFTQITNLSLYQNQNK